MTVLAAVFSISDVSQAAPLMRVSLAAPADAQLAGVTDPQQPMTVVLNLRRQRNDLEALAASVSDPSSPNYRRFRSVADIASEYGASTETQQAVRRWFEDRGIEATVDYTGSFATAQMDAESSTDLFGIDVSNYVDDRGRTFAAASGELTVPGGLAGAITSIGGLSNRPLETSVVPQDTAYNYPDWPAWAGRTGTPSPANCAEGNNEVGPGNLTTFTPDQLATAYDIAGNAPSGTAPNVAVIEIGEAVIPSDITAFTNCFNLPELDLHITTLDGEQDWTATCQQEIELCDEATIDVEVLAAFLPAGSRLNLITTAEFTNPFTQTHQVLSAALDPSRTGGRPVSVISSSLGGCEAEWPQADIDATESVLQTAAVAGVSVVFATGDTGSTACVQSGVNNDLSVQYPASSPWVTAVGGTNLQVDASNHLVDSQVSNDWPLQYDTAPPCPNANPCGSFLQDSSGGATSGSGAGSFTGFPKPAWQAKAGIAGQTRAIPDVALLMETQYAQYCTVCVGGPWTPGGGTSAAAPFFASMIALINQELGGSIGHANPLLYQIAQTPGANAFYDVTVGDNIIGSMNSSQVSCTADGSYCEANKFPVTCCYAAPGYDMASGWGSPMFGALADAVEEALAPAPPTPSTSSTAPPVSTASPTANAVVAAPRFTG